MVRNRHMLVFTALLAALCPMTVAGAGEIYKWVAEDGTTHYSQYPPLVEEIPVETLTIESSNPPDWDPGEYEYSILNQARRTEERLAAVRESADEAAPSADNDRSGLPPEPDVDDRYDERYPLFYYPWAHTRPFQVHRVHKHHRAGTRPKREPAHRFDYGDRFAHPARSHRRLGADKQFGYLGHRVTHRRSRDSDDW